MRTKTRGVQTSFYRRNVEIGLYTVGHKKCHLNSNDNFGTCQYGPILINFLPLYFLTNWQRSWNNVSPQICCYTICTTFRLLLRDARSAKRGIAIVSRPSVRPSVTLMYPGHGPVGWISSKLITRVISLGSSLLGAATSAI